MNARFAAIVGLSVLVAACTGGGTPTSPTPSTTTPYTYIFTGTLTVGGTLLFTPFLSEASDVTMTLVSVTPAGGGQALQSRIGLAYGTPDENDPANTCVRSSQTTVTPALITQFKVTSTAIAHCVEVFDAGGLGQNVDFALRVTTTPVLYKPPSPAVTAGTDVFASQLPIGGLLSRSFTVDRKSTRLNSSHIQKSRMPSSA